MAHLDNLDVPQMNNWSKQRFTLLLVLCMSLFLFLLPVTSHAQSAPAGIAKNARGTLVVVRMDGIEERLRGSGQLTLFEGDMLRTDDKSSALIELDSGIQVGLNRNTSVTIISRWEKDKGMTRILRLKQGMLWVDTRGPKQLEIETPVAIAAAATETEFVIEALKGGNSMLSVIKGKVEFGTAFGTCPIRTGTVSNAVQGQKCTKPVIADVKPAADWTAGLRGNRALPPPSPAPAPASPTAASLPLFWPPPDASARQKIPRELLVPKNAPTQTWISVAERLEKALDDNGYSSPGYYAVPGGFALISQLERINPDATPSPPNVRWKVKVDPVSIASFNLEAYLKALLGKDAGFFRVIAFVFTPVPIVTSGKEADIKDAQSWVGKGGSQLPQDLARQIYGVDMVATALIYEFEIPRHGEPARLNKPSGHNGQQHLKAAKILQALGG